MVKRQLTNEEKEISEKNLIRLENELEENKEALYLINLQEEFKIKTRLYEKARREYNDKVRPYNDREQDEQDKKNKEQIELNIKQAEENIKNLKSHLKDGVEIKHITGV